MAEDAIKQRLKRIKKSIINHLQNADYQIIISDNDTLCVIGARDREWRCIKGHFRKIPYLEVKKMEMLPCPDGRIIKKELWLRDSGETQFYKITWNETRQTWIDQFGIIVKFN